MDDAELIAELTDALMDMVSQHCSVLRYKKKSSPYVLDSMCISANANAIRLLARMGKIEIIVSQTKRVIGKWIK